MDGFAIAVIALFLGIAGIVTGFGIGTRLSTDITSNKQYWLTNLYAFLVGIGVSAVIWAFNFVVLSFATIGCLAGVIAGLKMGYGESIGPWRVHDRFMRINKDAVKAAPPKAAGKGWAVRKPKGEAPSAEPELMSVADTAPAPEARSYDGDR